MEFRLSYQLAAVTFAILAALYFSARWYNKPDPREPPYIRSYIPHILYLIRYGAKYFEIVNKGKDHGIFTLPMLGSRNYVVADPFLAGHIQRNAKTLSFYSLIVEVTRRLIAFDKEATKITFYNMNGEHGPGGLMERVHDMMNVHLGPGLGLDSVTSVQVERMGVMLDNAIPPNSQQSVATNLYAWQRHIFGVCNAYAIYGPENIFAMHPELENAFWEFEDGMLGLVIDILPSITARKPFFARRRVLNGLVEYVKEARYKKASPLIQERVLTNLEFGMSEEMAGHAELILMFGILGNAVPSNFWLITNIFTQPTLLERIRREVQLALGLQSFSNDSEKVVPVTVHSKKITMKSCPLLYSCYRETLRDISLLTSARLVLEDTLVPRKDSAGHFLLRKNSVVQIAGGVIHHDPKVWGEDSGVFNPDRFILPGHSEKEPAGSVAAAPLPTAVPSSAFRAFGGGTVICPGRHFAQSELMTFAAVLAVGFDILDLVAPPKDDERIPLSVMKPMYDPKVRIQRRKGWESIRWDITT